MNADQPVCPSCGMPLQPRKRRCSHCGRQVAEPWPESTPLPLPPTQSMYQAAPRRRSRLPVLIEFISGAIGIHGIGYWMVGKRGRAVGWLIFSFFWEVSRLALLAATAGFGIVCLLPIGFCIAIWVALGVNRAIRRLEREEEQTALINVR
jgi:hypothetical protein